MSGFRFGTAIREITPAYPVWLCGYSARDHKSSGVAEPIYLGCMAVGNDEKTVLVVTCDLLGIRSHVCEQLYDLLEHETGIGYPDVLLSCSHTHFAPVLHSEAFTSPQVDIVDPDPRFVIDFKTKLVEAARESIRNMQPGRLQTVRLHVPQVLFNRRTVAEDGSVQESFLYPTNPRAYAFGPTDTELAVLRLTDETGVGAVLVNFGCHPVTGGEVQERDHYKVSADYPSYLRRTVAEQYGCPVFFTLGAAGDAVPINRYGDCRQRIGSVLGNTVVLAERLYAVEDHPDVRTDSLALDVRTIIQTDRSAAEMEYEQAKAQFAAMWNDPDLNRANGAYRAASETFSRNLTALLRSRLYPNNRYTVKVQFLTVGCTTLIGLPFEVLSEISLKVKERFPSSILVSCAGGYQGYLPLAYEYERGGYEASEESTHFMPGTADRLLEAILGWLEKQT